MRYLFLITFLFSLSMYSLADTNQSETPQSSASAGSQQNKAYDQCPPPERVSGKPELPNTTESSTEEPSTTPAKAVGDP